MNKMSNQFKYAYFHGFASGTKSAKGVLIHNYIQSKYNINISLPDLNIPEFQHTTITNMLQSQLDHICKDDNIQYRLIGSSLGGYIAALLYQQQQLSSHTNNNKHNNNIDSLILLCPAFDASNRWNNRMTTDEILQWKQQGTKSYYNYNTQSNELLNYTFYDDLLKYTAFPIVQCPVTIIHGKHDDVVPIDSSRHYNELLKQNNNNNVKLIEVDDDHSLMKPKTIDIIKHTIDEMWFTNAWSNSL